MKTLESSISEQQKIFMKRGSLDNTKYGYYIMAMPSEQIATICVLHLMRHLFKEFVSDIHQHAEQ
jgi:hypothetical protein